MYGLSPFLSSTTWFYHATNYIRLLRLMVNLLLVLVRMLMSPSSKNLRWKLLLRRWRRRRRFVFLAFIFKITADHLMLIGLTSPLHDFMRSNCCPVYHCADNIPFSYFTPPIYPFDWTTDTTTLFVTFFASFSRGAFRLWYIYSWSQF